MVATSRSKGWKLLVELTGLSHAVHACDSGALLCEASDKWVKESAVRTPSWVEN